MLFAACFLSLLLFAIHFTLSDATIHGDSFVPDAVLRVTLQTISLGGIQRPTTLINGTVPGPELRLPEGGVAWIRVHNDMKDRNVTMVRLELLQLVLLTCSDRLSTGMA